MTKIDLLRKPTSPRYPLFVCLGILGVLVVLHFFVLQIVYPNIVGSLDVYIPAKTGGKDYLVGVDTFTIISIISLVVVVVMAGIVAVLLRLKKTNATIMATCAALVLSGMYAAIIVGNSFHALWGTLWSVIGVIAIVIAVTALEFPLIMSIDSPMNRRKQP